MDTVSHMIDLLSEDAIQEHNVRISYINNIITKYKYLEADINIALVDTLCDYNNKELEQVDILLHGYCTEYAKYTAIIRKEELDYE
jgi:hypothetical protein